MQFANEFAFLIIWAYLLHKPSPHFPLQHVLTMIWGHTPYAKWVPSWWVAPVKKGELLVKEGNFLLEQEWQTPAPTDSKDCTFKTVMQWHQEWV